MKIPPIAPTDSATDPYAWLEQRDAPAVLAYLQAENAYLAAQLDDTRSGQEIIYQEIKARIRETDLSLPEPKGPYLYYQRTTAGEEYPRYYRCPRGNNLTIDESHETLLLDPNALAPNGFLSVGCLEISPDHRRLAYSLDLNGEETYQLFVKDLYTGEISPLAFEQSDGSMVWGNDNRTLYVIERDETYRPFRLHRHTLGSSTYETLLTESDPRFFLACYRASSEQYLIVLSASKTTTQAWILDGDVPAEPISFNPRREGHEYYPDHGVWDGKSCWFIRTNRDGIHYALYRCAEQPSSERDWQCDIPHDARRTLEDITLHQDALILSWREKGLPIVEVRQPDQPHYRIELPDQIYSLEIQNELEFDSPVIRLRYEALNRPAQIRQLTLASGQQTVLKQIQVEGPFDPDHYLSARLWATSADGTAVPITYVAHRQTLERVSAGHPAPLYLYGYGAYGQSLDPWFSHARLSLLDRGWIFALAHVRGGGDLGEDWYRSGRLADKTNTFTDFIHCARHLIEQGFTESGLLAINGASAGGLLIGTVLNQAPELFQAAIAEVPFVDVLNTMMNPELPLTITEYDEWGDPHDPAVYARLKAYSPYENVTAQAYPALLVTAGYHDTRVAYWEAAKWVAKLRAHKTDHHLLLLKTEFEAGHSGKSGRYQAWRDVALEYAFLFKALGLDVEPTVTTVESK